MEKSKIRVRRFKDQITGLELKVASIPRTDLEVASFQRKPSKAHIQNLANSIRRMGFLVPLVVYEDNGRYIIIDGQHRFLAGESLGMNEFLSVIVPKELGVKMINLNIEKQPNIREKAYVAHNLYMYLLSEDPNISETDGRVEDSVEMPYYITLGFAYSRNEKFHGGAFEPIISKVDGYLDMSLADAKVEREKRADLLLEIDSLLDDLVAKMKELELSIHPFVRKDILSFVNPIKGRGKRGEFWDVFSSIKSELEVYREDPKRLIEIRSEEEF